MRQRVYGQLFLSLQYQWDLGVGYYKYMRKTMHRNNNSELCVEHNEQRIIKRYMRKRLWRQLLVSVQ